MLSAITVGRPSAITSCANTRCCSRFEASSTITSTSGAASPGNSPRTTLRVTSSSGLVGCEPVGAGQVGQLDRLAARQHQPPRLALDRDARIVGDLLARAGQRVEQRALAGVGIADQRGGAVAGHRAQQRPRPASRGHGRGAAPRSSARSSPRSDRPRRTRRDAQPPPARPRRARARAAAAPPRQPAVDQSTATMRARWPTGSRSRVMRSGAARCARLIATHSQ